MSRLEGRLRGSRALTAVGVLTVLDFVHYGVTVLDILAILVLVLFMVGIVGALRQPPSE